MNLAEFASSSTFRAATVAAVALSLFVLVLFGFIYWKTDRLLVTRSDHVIALQLQTVAALPNERRLEALHLQLSEDSRDVHFVGLFRADGSRVAGNLERPPAMLRLDATVQTVEIIRPRPAGPEQLTVQAIGQQLPDGEILVIGRYVDEAIQLSMVVSQALALGLIPALLLCLALGALLSLRAERRIAGVNERIQRIVAGSLHERLPVNRSRGRDPFTQLAGMVNSMLDEIETLIHTIAGVGNDIAHDLRTPLTRARLVLERGRDNARTLPELRSVVDKGIASMDQSLAIAAALLRLAEIENSRRSTGFGKVALEELLHEVRDLYAPIAEDKGITLRTDIVHAPVVEGDRDLLMEAIANLVDNAVKFTPRGGQVQITTVSGDGESILRITDTGAGIGEHERSAVLRRFYRSDAFRKTPGLGLGLNLVATIAKLHGFRLTIFSGAGCVIEIGFPDASEMKI
ncbi:sensor histidine kinase [Tardiphaga sp. 42S5]|uniref:sensor histidine kinase n=1 Tax=Tardiphaga sp. 42S5 TaxID=1404799 RepID=UPI002A5B02CD|nr:ATP-binding protein [Tardiphaga sp. 42S5]WPO41245.1 ATP-binding protein [Tardiphaga sp. 42S5]